MSDQGQLDALLSAMEAAGRPSSMSLPRPAGLRNFTELAGWLSGPGSGPAGQDRTIAGPSGPLPIRIYGPDRLSSSAAGPGAAAVMFFHGGGWVLGGLDSHDALCRELARQAGMVIVAVDYRLAPEHPYPAGLDDCTAATRWVASHAAELGAGGSGLALVGESAGASLAAGVAVRARDQGDFAVTFQALAYPALDPAMDTASYAANGDDPFLSRTEMKSYWSLYLGDTAPDSLAAPALARDLGGLPPAYVLVAGRDVLRDEGIAYASRLAAAGVPVQLRDREEMVHGFLLYTAWLDAARDGIAELATVLRTELGSAGST